jgi:hypothetical protein
MSEWISVEDRLPEKQSWNHIAILDTKTGRISVEQDLYAIETAEKFKQKKGFCKDGRFNGREVVIAWMPFPEPPISKQVTSSKRKPATETCLFCGQVIPDKKHTHRKSKWEISSDGYYPYCKECGYAPPGRNMTKYCPGCGTLMIEEETE